MATADLRQFYFYEDYIWTPTDFANFQTWVWGAFQSVFEGHLGAAVLKGLEAMPAGGLTLNLNPGIATGDNGEIMVSPNSLNPVLSAPGINQMSYLVLLRPISTDMTFIPTPDNPSIPVPLHAKKSFQLVVLSKVMTGQNDYPAKQNGDVIVVGVQLPPGASVIAQSNLDFGITDRPRKNPKKIVAVSANWDIDPVVKDIYEGDCSLGGITGQLPPAVSANGEMVTVVKVDSTPNHISVSGYGAEDISGQNVVTLDSQWDKITVYSNGLAWRIV